MARQFQEVINALEADEHVRVVVLYSAVDDYFLNHSDFLAKLEHSRMLWFRNGGNEEVYVGSADLMPHNLNRRVEVLFPIRSQRLARRVRDEILNQYLRDDNSARHMRSDGSYTTKPRNGRHDSQTWFLAQRPSPTNGIGPADEPQYVKCSDVEIADGGMKPVPAIAPIFSAARGDCLRDARARCASLDGKRDAARVCRSTCR